MQLGFVSAILPDLSLREVLSFAAHTGYECVELMCWPAGKADRRYAGVTHIDTASLGPDSIARIQELLEEFGLSISGLGYYPNPLTPDRSAASTAIDHIESLILAAEALHIPVVNTFAGNDWSLPLEDNWPRFLEVWRPLVKTSEERGIRLAIENCPMFFTRDEWPGGKNLARSPMIWRRMFEDIPSPYFGLNYDPSHMVWQGMDHLKPLREFSSRIFHMHLKDVRMDRERLDDCGILATPLSFHTPKLPGLGEIDWGRFFSVLGETGYQGSVCVEVEDRDFEASLESRKRALVQSCAHIRQFLPAVSTAGQAVN